MIKITYNLSKSINIESLDIIPSIHEKLVSLGYEIISEDNDTIGFKNNFWQMGSRTKGFTKVDGGKFSVIGLKNETELVLSYYVSFEFVIYYTVFSILASLIVGYEALYFLLVVIVILLLRIDNVKSLGKGLIDTILL